MSRVRSVLLGVAIALPIAAGFAAVQWWRHDTELPTYGTLPDFTLLDQDSTPFRRADLLDRVWIVGFVYTHCPDVCPLITERMARFRDELAKRDDLGDVRLLSVSVDPGRDTPAVLRQYATRFKAAKPDWVFLTGQPDSVLALITKGFLVPVMARPDHTEHAEHGAVDKTMIPHTDRIVLVDRTGNIRGTYPFSEPGSLEQLWKDARRLH